MAIAGVLGLAIQSGCGLNRAMTEPVFFVTGRGLEDASITLNGEPVCRGISGRPLSRTGMNTLTVEGRSSELSDYSYEMYRGKVGGLNGSEKLIWSMKGKGGREPEDVVGRFNYSVDGRWKWEWEKAEKLDDFSEKDEMEIGRVFVKFCNLLRKRGTSSEDILGSGFVVPWSYEKSFLPRSRELLDRGLSTFWEYGDEFISSNNIPPEDLVLRVGNRLVAGQHPENERIFFLGFGKKPKGMRILLSIQTNHIYFARFDGEWKAILWFG